MLINFGYNTLTKCKVLLSSVSFTSLNDTSECQQLYLKYSVLNEALIYLHFNKWEKCVKGLNLNSVYFNVSYKVQRLVDLGLKQHTRKTAIRELKSRRKKPPKYRDRIQKQQNSFQNSDNFFAAGAESAQAVKQPFFWITKQYLLKHML